jgi:galactose-1-phosphate uridylyltransferase
LKLHQLCGLNLLIHEFCRTEEHRNNAAGIELGLNSSIRHLVLGKKTHTSAGASIPHIHKQVWGMVSRSSNLAEQLICVSQAYWSEGIDYLECYQKALRQHQYVIWEDKHVMLYVPYGQCAMHEMQAMTVQPCGSFTELTTEQVISLSKAEYIALRIFKALGVGSFNQVFLTKLYNDSRAPRFRLVEAFITRDVDLAVSELSMLYVVDRHPWVSRIEVAAAWESLVTEVTKELAEYSGPRI